MMPQAAAPIFQPDTDLMRQHLEFLFSNMDDYCDGRIEISILNKSENFSYDQIAKAIEMAVLWNNEKKNVYVVGSLLNPDTFPGARSKDEDFYCTSVLWCDLDKDVNPDSLKEKYKDCSPHMSVITGRTPNLRAHLWWKLEQACNNTEKVKEALSGLQQQLGGDPAVKNITSLMRLGGSVSWPVKDGRVTEKTEVRSLKNTRGYPIEHIIKSFPSNLSATGGSVNDDFRRPLTGELDIVALLDKTREPGHWHQSMLRATASMVGRGWTDEQILLACANYSDGEENDGDVRKLISTARKKFDTSGAEAPRFDEETGEIKERLLPQWIARDKFKGDPPEMEWLVEGIFPLGVPALLAAMGGLGKSFSILDMCIKIASPPGGTPHKAFGGNIRARGKIVYFTAEDSQQAIHRRIKKLVDDKDLEATKDNLYILPMPDIGPELFIKEDKDGIHTTSFYKQMLQEMQEVEGDIVLIAVDPMQAFVGADITARPEAGQFVWTSFSNMAAKTGATVLFSHHMRKDGLKSIKTIADAREAIRGSTALVDGSRLTYAMWQANESAGMTIADKLEIEYVPERIVQGAVVKTNDEADQQIHTYIREESGILKDRGVVDTKNEDGFGLTNEQAGSALREIRIAWEEGKPFRSAPQSPRCVVKWLMKTFKVSRAAATYQRDNWMCPPLGSEPLIEERSFKDTKRRERDGLYVVNIP